MECFLGNFLPKTRQGCIPKVSFPRQLILAVKLGEIIVVLIPYELRFFELDGVVTKKATHQIHLNHLALANLDVRSPFNAAALDGKENLHGQLLSRINTARGNVSFPLAFKRFLPY